MSLIHLVHSPHANNQQPIKNNLLEIKFRPNNSSIVLRHNGTVNQSLLQIYWPTDDNSNIKLSTQMSLLARIIKIKLIELVREKKRHFLFTRCNKFNVFHNSQLWVFHDRDRLIAR